MTGARVPITHFASAERVPIDIIRRQAATFDQVPEACQALEAANNYVFILNQQRQIVFASRNTRQLIPGMLREQLLSLRPGEALDCIRAHECESGCGTSESCRQCGALQAILSSLAGGAEMREFRLTRFIACHQETAQFTAMAAPLKQGEEIFCLLALADSQQPEAMQALARLAAQTSSGGHRPQP
jgi:hypothetical protein